MHAFLMALGHLLYYSFVGLVWGWMGTSFLALVVGVIVWAVPYIEARIRGEKIVNKPRITSSAIVVGVTWVLLFAASLVETVYRDHLNLVSQNGSLGTQNQSLAQQNRSNHQEIDHLKDQLTATCYKPDRHLTLEQHDLLYKPLKDLAEKDGHPYLDIGYFQGDQESNRYFGELYVILKETGWKLPSEPIERPLRKNSSDPPDLGVGQGVSISIQMDTSTEEHRKQRQLAADISQIFYNANVQFGQYPIGPDNQIKDRTHLILWVGLKQ